MTREFTFTFPLTYVDWRGRERECDATVRYSFDGERFECLSAIADDDASAAEYALDECVDEVIAARCDDDWRDALDDEDEPVRRAA